MDLPDTLDEIQNETFTLLQSLYARYMNESNKNNLDKCMHDLQFYRYVYDGYNLFNGISYIRYIYRSDINNLKLKTGGIVIQSSPYFLRVKLLKYNKIVYLNRRSIITFVKLTDDEMLKLQFNK